MSQLVPFLAKLKESGAERVVFTPDEQAYAVDGAAKRPVTGGTVKGAAILEAVSELLSQDDIDGLSSARPRIVRHEHDGEDFVLEISRQANGIALGIRQGAKPGRAPMQPPLQVPKTTARASRRMRAPVLDEPPPTVGKRRAPEAMIELELGAQATPARQIDPKIQLQEERNETAPARRNAEAAGQADAASPQVMLLVREVARDAAREAARDAAREAAREVARESLREAREAAQEAARDAVRESGHGLTQPAAAARSHGVEPARSGPARIDGLLRDMIQRKGSDLHLSSNSHPVLRVDGQIQFDQDRPVLASKDILEMVREIMPARSRHDFETTHDADFAYEIPGLARFRVNVFEDRKGVGAVLRQIPIEIISAEKLGLPKACLDLCRLTKGLVLVTGPTGSGKSTTLAAMIDYINKNRTDHVITIEDPVEFVHQNHKCLINQREIGQHTMGFKSALRAALREDPDIVLVGEMRDLETIAIAIETAETGHLVFGTLHTTTAISTVDRIIDQFPADRQEQIRVMLSESLKGVVAQILCSKIGGGRVAAHEILLGNHAVSAMIREGKTFQLASVMQTSKGQGMTTLNDSLMNLVQNKLVDPKHAYMKAVDKSGFATMLRSMGIAPPA
jgi:twitching motility protein PilT